MGEWINTTYAAILAACLAAIGFLVRKIFTNEAKIEVLESRLTMFDDLEEDIKELRSDVRNILLSIGGR